MQKSRYDVLDGMRGIAAIAVMLFHFSGHQIAFLPGMPKVSLFHNATLAVDFFFILSGFVICHAYGSRLLHGMSLREFLIRRVIRLYPMFLLGLVLGTIVLAVLVNTPSATISYRAVAAAFVQNSAFIPFLNNFGLVPPMDTKIIVGEAFPANPPAWSLFFEMFASVAFIWLVRFQSKSLMVLIGCSYVAFIIMGTLAHFIDKEWGCDLGGGWGGTNFMAGFPRVLFGFSLGVLLFKSLLDKGSNLHEMLGRLGRSLPPSSYLVYGVLVLVLAFPVAIKGLYPASVLLIIAPVLVVWGSAITCKGKIETKLAHFLGWLSYPVYCLHFPVGRAVNWVGKMFGWSEMLQFGVALAVAILLTIVLTKLIEEPTRAWLTDKLLRGNVRVGQPVS